MGILRIHDDEDEIILLVCAYLEHLPVHTNIQRRQYPHDNIYRYLYRSGSLWVDLITVSRVNGPLIGLYDSDSMNYLIIHSIDTSKQYRFNILHPFYQDSRFITDTSKVAYDTLLNNLLTYIPLPSTNELVLFKSYAYPIIENSLDEEIDIEVH